MATSPQYPATGLIAWNAVDILTANTAMTGTGTVGTDIGLLSPLGGGTVTIAANASAFVDYITVAPQGSNVATAFRIFVNNGSTNATAANNTLLFDITAPATTVSNVAGLAPLYIPVKRLFTAGSNGINFYYTIGTTVSSGFGVTLHGGIL